MLNYEYTNYMHITMRYIIKRILHLIIFTRQMHIRIDKLDGLVPLLKVLQLFVPDLPKGRLCPIG